MADVSKLLPIILQWEGGFVNDPLDRGGATNMGVTLQTWRSCGYDLDGDGDIDKDDVKILEKSDVQIVLKKYYWNRWKADQIENQSVANILVDWVWASGAWGIKIPQRLLELKQDGVVGPKTLEKVNSYNQEELFNLIKQARLDFVDGIVSRDPSQKRFEKGWKNRINYFQFE